MVWGTPPRLFSGAPGLKNPETTRKAKKTKTKNRNNPEQQKKQTTNRANRTTTKQQDENPGVPQTLDTVEGKNIVAPQNSETHKTKQKK